MFNVRRALVSVSDKRGLIPFVTGLAELGVEILSTGGTCRQLREAGLEVIEVSEKTGFPEIMDGRVKTLHPIIHGGLLGRRGTDESVMAEHGIEPIDLLVVNLYPFEQTIAREDATIDDAIENIDIGGPAMIRAASKNHVGVAVIVEPDDYESVLDALKSEQMSLDSRRRLAAKAFAHTANYDTAITTYLTKSLGDDTLTSGDIGSAVAQAFLSVPGIRTVILFPKGKVTPLQERQFTTLGGNVRVLEVDGTFDDCQRLVKSAFADPLLSDTVRLSSANSINIGRLLPQIFYYVHAAAQLPRASAPLFSVPSGNFGNLTAGLMAKKLGVASRGFVAATNVNDVVPEYLQTAVFLPRPSIPTISNAMDVGDPSNFARILALYDGDVDRLRKDLIGSVHDDDETRDCIAGVYERTGYVLDPHSAVSYLGVEAGRRAFGEGPSVVLCTAHPVKFREAVEPAIGSEVPVPERLEACLQAERHVTPIPPEPSALRDFLLSD